MTLLAPIWLVMLVPLGLALWLWRPASAFLLAVRLLSVLLVVLALAGLALRLPSRDGTVVIVCDRSRSMPNASEREHKEWIGLVQKGMGGDDRLAVVAFGQNVAVEQPPQLGSFGGFSHQVGDDASSLGEAIDTALSLIPRGSPGRLLVFSDGRYTGRDPAPIASLALGRNVAIDYRLQQRPTAGDLAVSRLDAPASVSVGESFLITAWVVAPAPQTISYVLKRGDEVISSGKRAVRSGQNRLMFRDRAVVVGNQPFTLSITGTEGDPVPENNTAKLLVGVTGPRPILHLSGSPRSGLAKLLTAGGLDMRLARPEAFDWSLENLQRYSAVVVENVPAERIGHHNMELLAAWTREAGGGLVLTGGRSSYGPGGYHKSPIDPLLPISMELRNEHRKLSLAIVVALDRSGSMRAPVAGGRVKMDLANQGTAAVLDLLGPQDEFGCLAVDTRAHVIANLGKVENKGPVRSKILGIQSDGGGIFVYEALSAASQMLLKATAGTRHIILFADAADAEEPGRYVELMEKTEKAGITVSVIGLGKETDQDGELLKDIAKRGKGRVFFTDKAEELPRLFAQDTFVVARNTFIDEKTGVRHVPGLSLLTDRPPPKVPGLSVGGYNLTYLRQGATQATVTEDEYAAPLAAAWQAGAGRVVCYTGEADGEYAGAMAKWPGVGEYYASLVRWAAGQGNPLRGNMLVTQRVREGVNVVQLHLDPDRKGDAFTGLPRVTTLRSRPGRSPRIDRRELSWAGPDTLALEVPLGGDESSLTTVEVPGQGVVALPPVCLPYSPEFRPALADRGLVTLEGLAHTTGGGERLDLAEIWGELPREARVLPLARWLLLAAVGLWLVEVLERRTSLLSHVSRRLRRERGAEEAEPADEAAARPAWVQAKAKAGAIAVPELPPLPEQAAPMPEVMPTSRERGDVIEAMRRARERLRGRGEG